jgi:DNA polymerase III delta subunit
MLYLFLGKDTFSKQQHLQQLALQHKAELSRINSADSLNMGELTEPTLFSNARLFVLDSLISKIDFDTQVESLIASPHVIVLLEDALDKRKKTSTQWLMHKGIKVEEFVAPNGPGLTQWLVDGANKLKINLDKTAAEYLISVLMPASTSRFVEPVADLWQFDSELRKLGAYAGGQTITKTMIDELATKNTEVEAWDITNALAERDTKRAFIAMENFFADQSLDDKAKTIQLNALLADQFRNILLAQDFSARKVPDAEILKQTGWKSGRLFIMKKLAGKFKPAQLLSILDKLERLDIETKTTTAPGQAILQLILAQLA